MRSSSNPQLSAISPLSFRDDPEDSLIGFRPRQFGITSFEGMTNLISLRSLYAQTSNHSPIDLPSTLQELRLDGLGLTSFNWQLPPFLNVLSLSSNLLSSFSTELPSTLRVLQLSNNSLTSFSAVIPSSLTTLDLGNNQITFFSQPAPTSLTYLNVSFNQLSSSSINFILEDLVEKKDAIWNHFLSTGRPELDIFLHSQTPSSPPSSQGLADKQALSDLGFRVSTD